MPPNEPGFDAPVFQEYHVEDNLFDGLDVPEEPLWTCPITGSIIDPTNIDKLIETVYLIKEQVSDLQFHATKCKSLLVAMDDDTKSKTTRVQGESSVVKIVKPDAGWDQQALAAIMHVHPRLSEKIVKVDKLKVMKRELDKFMRTSGGESVELLKESLKQANLGPSRAPTVTVEVLHGKRL